MDKTDPVKQRVRANARVWPEKKNKGPNREKKMKNLT